MILVNITPRTKYARQRVREHGQQMEWLRFNPGTNKVLVKSLAKTWHGEHWMGWIDADEVKPALRPERA